MFTEVRRALRRMRREVGITATIVLTLALAIGANTAIFSVSDGLLLRPLPLPRPDRLLVLERQFASQSTDSLSVPKFLYFHRSLTQVFAHLAACETLGSGFNLVGDGTPQHLRGSRVSAEFLATMGVAPQLGRDFTAEDDRPGAARVVLLSHRLWARRFASDPEVVGRPMTLNGEVYTVIGVMPPVFRYPSIAELWIPFGMNPASAEPANYFQVIGRLRDGVAPESAAAAVKASRAGYVSQFPQDLSTNESFTATSLQKQLYGAVRPALLILLAAVAAVLLIACVNVANLQLARGASRGREIAVRSALGATAWRVVAPLLTESLVYAVMGGLAGLGLGVLALHPLLALSPTQLDPLQPINVNPRVLLFTMAVSLLAGVLFGLAPALQAARTPQSEALKEGSHRTAGNRAGRWLRRCLVVTEIALAMVLVTSAALLVRSFVGMMETPSGFDSSHVLTAKLSLPSARFGKAARLAQFATAIDQGIAAIPGVEAAAFTSSLPLQAGPDLSFEVEGRKTGGPDGHGNFDADYQLATPSLFKVLRIPLLRGRGFTAADRLQAPLVALVSETTARTVWPGKDPIGQRIVIGPPPPSELADRGARTIIGVVADVHQDGLDRKMPSVVYLPLEQAPDAFLEMIVRLLPMSLAVRSEHSSPTLAADVRRAVWAVDGTQPIDEIRSMEEIRSMSLGTRRFSALLLGLLSLLALVLAAVGIYGVLSYLVHERTREIGVRRALGASTSQVMKLVLGQGVGAAGVGIVIGLIGSFALSGLLRGLVYGVTARDPVTFVLTPLVLGIVAVLASSLPARRATRLDPLVALREE